MVPQYIVCAFLLGLLVTLVLQYYRYFYYSFVVAAIFFVFINI